MYEQSQKQSKEKVKKKKEIRYTLAHKDNLIKIIIKKHYLNHPHHSKQ